MRSGLVMVDLPEDAAAHSPEMPEGGVWMAAVSSVHEPGWRLGEVHTVKVRPVRASSRRV